MSEEKNHAEEQAKAQLKSIVELVEQYKAANDGILYKDHDSDYIIIEDEDSSLVDDYYTVDLDEIRERMEENALSVEVQSGWQSIGETLEPEAFMILLCTGGPAVRIKGELDYGEARRAWIEYQDWGTPWTQYHHNNYDELLQYVNTAFYFGE